MGCDQEGMYLASFQPRPESSLGFPLQYALSLSPGAGNSKLDSEKIVVKEVTTAILFVGYHCINAQKVEYMELKEKLPLLNSSSKNVRLVGYVAYAVVILLLLRLISGLLL